jgi:hypothetical protein
MRRAHSLQARMRSLLYAVGVQHDPQCAAGTFCEHSEVASLWQVFTYPSILCALLGSADLQGQAPNL